MPAGSARFRQSRATAVCHIGAGTGYYSAILSVLTLARRHRARVRDRAKFWRKRRATIFEPFENVSVTTGDATKLPLPPSDLIYVNAGVVAPPPSWLQALRPQGRMIFPWRPSASVGLAFVISRGRRGFSVKPLMNSYFIPCVGASNAEAMHKNARQPRSMVGAVGLADADREPDETAVAIYKHLWFSSAEIPAEDA